MSQMDRKEDRKEAIKFGPAQPRARQSDQLNAAEVWLGLKKSDQNTAWNPG